MYGIFDQYQGSIKSHERERRTCGAVPPDIKMTMTTPLPARNVLMKNVNNKKQLIGLLCSVHDDDDDVNMKMIGLEDDEF